MNMATGSDSIWNILNQGVQAINSLRQVLLSVFPQTGGTATTATGGSATLPANPVGFIVVTLPDGTSAKVPYYV
ncbi:hypothetical protein [Rhizobium lusitanum]|uniref:Uncharacterized protein n=1 Tax=Rhizobium lusitanum TaxID=293958 RepID=A0A1C3VRL8_9HYPH|nr:hypothetical protein [Rhizobium lusitanum]SCB30257.1 hypothetical protein GA0061101_10682 [Rhizobium lusitanum]